MTKFPDQHDAFTEITKAIREAAQQFPPRSAKRKARITAAIVQSTPRPEQRSSNLRIKKTFTDHDKDAFLDNTFESIANFFEGSLDELQRRNPDITTRFKRMDATRFTAFVYRAGKSISECGVRLDRSFGSNRIAYSCQADSTNSFNESLSVQDNGHSQFLKPMGTMMMSDVKRELTVEGAAEYLWASLMQPLQR